MDMGEVNGKHFIHNKLFFLNSSQLFFYAFTMAGQAAGELPLVIRQTGYK
jgi:hypothetical protein